MKGLNLDDVTFDDITDETEVEVITSGNSEVENLDSQNEQEKRVNEKEKSEERDESEKEEKNEGEVDDGESGENEEEDSEEKDDGEEDDGAEEASVIESIIASLGVEDDFKERGINVDDFELSVDGVIKLVQQSSDVLANQAVDSFLNSNPILKEFAEYISNGGNERDFATVVFPEVDYSQVEIKDEDVVSQERVIRSSLKSQGLEDKEIGEYITSYKDAGVLHTQAKLALRTLARNQENEKKTLLEEQKKAAEQSEREQEEFWTGIKKVITDSKELSGLPLPEKEKNGFIDYLTKPIDDKGNTKRNVDVLKMDINQRLALDYLLFKGFDLNEILKRKVKTEKVNSLKKALLGKKEEASSKGNERSRNKTSPVDEVLEELDVSIFG